MSTITYKEVSFILVYFLEDKTFEICSVDDTNFNEDFYTCCVKSLKVILKGSYDCKHYDCIGKNHKHLCIVRTWHILKLLYSTVWLLVVQLGRSVEALQCTLEFCANLKQTKRVSVETILREVPRFAPLNKRQSF